MTHDKQLVANPFAAPTTAGAGHPGGGSMVDVEAQRAVAETQAAMLLAKRFPRDQIEATDRILAACTRQSLAEQALYEYSRGGTPITGPSIRLAEAIAQAWGNIDFGIKELEQRDGESVVMAYAHDLETNTRQVKVFTVPHMRKTRKGTYKLDDPRDIYEMVANQGARRLRACILGVIPGDVIEAAVKQCEVTMRTHAEVTPERIKDMLEKFETYGVTKEVIEKRIQRRIDAMTPAMLVQLGKIYTSLRDGMSKPGDWFEMPKEETKSEAADAVNAMLDEQQQPKQQPEKKPRQKRGVKKKEQNDDAEGFINDCPDGKGKVPKSYCAECFHREGCPAWPEE